VLNELVYGKTRLVYAEVAGVPGTTLLHGLGSENRIGGTELREEDKKKTCAD